MRLARFILQNMESILQEWEDFAGTVETSLPKMDPKGLRNHAAHILTAAANDMETPQTAEQQIEKSQGRMSASSGMEAATTHGETRLIAGFTLAQMVSEYRALRSTVLRLWLVRGFPEQQSDVNDIIRFNETIDEALTASIESYEKGVEAARETILAMLGHDLRSPLTAAGMGAQVLYRRDYIAPRDRLICSNVVTSVNRANAMVNDLLDLARSSLGNGIMVVKQPVDLVRIARNLVEEHRIGHPKADIQLDTVPSINGKFDANRMGQVFSNLIANAIQHGDTEQPITVRIRAEDDMVKVLVHNYGEAISEVALPNLFALKGPYLQSGSDGIRRSGGLGLGLYIASQIVKSHDGDIRVGSADDSGTVFEVTVPLGSNDVPS
jgi:signal transduction histidine kinase